MIIICKVLLFTIFAVTINPLGGNMRYSSKRNKGTIIAGILSAFMLVGILVVCVVYLSHSQQDNLNSNDNTTMISGIDKNLVESETIADLLQRRDEVSYHINLTPQLIRSHSTLLIDNPQEHRY